MTAATDYEAARKRVEADLAFSEEKRFIYASPKTRDLRAILASPPEPSVEEVARVIAMFPIYEEDFGPDNEVFADIVPTGGAELGECPTPIQRLAVAVQALYRSARA